MRIGRVLKIIVGVGLLYYCRSCFMYMDMTHLSDSDLLWYNPGFASYSKTFYSDNGDEATMYLTDKYKENSYDPFRILWERNSLKYEACLGYFFTILHEDREMQVYCKFSRLIGYDSLMVRSNLDNFYTKSGIKDSDLLGYYIPVKTSDIEIDSVMLDDCIVFDSSNSEYKYFSKDTLSRNRIDKYILSRQFGLVYYRFEDGTEYRRRLRITD